MRIRKVFCTTKASMVSQEWEEKWLELVLPEEENAA
jgi:hypothetical protein